MTAFFLPFAFAAVFLIKFARVVFDVAAEDRFSKSSHQLMQEGDVVQAQKHCAVHLSRVDKVAQIRLGVMLAAQSMLEEGIL